MTAVEGCLLVRRFDAADMRCSSSVSAEARKPKKLEPQLQYASSRPRARKCVGTPNGRTDRGSRTPGQVGQRVRGDCATQRM